MTTASTRLTDQELVERDALVGRLYESTIGALELLHVYLGDRLGLFRALATAGPLTAAGLASAAGINERYAREWLEQEAVAGILVVEAKDDGADGRRYSLPRGHAEVVNDADSLNFLAPLARGVVGIGAVMPNVVEAFRTGGGVPYEAYGEVMRSSISSGNRTMFHQPVGRQVVSSDNGCRPPSAFTATCARSRRRVRNRLVQHRHRQGISRGYCRWLRSRLGFDRGRSSQFADERRCRSGHVSGS